MLHLDAGTFSVVLFPVLLAGHADVALLAKEGLKIVARNHLFY